MSGLNGAKSRPFLIVGGGIGGLAAALAIARQGRPVTVLEQAPEFSEVGAGLQLAPNALAVLDQLGVLDAVIEKAVLPKRLVIMDAMSGRQLSVLDLDESFVAKYGYPYIVTHRSDLLDALLDGCRTHPNITLLNHKEVISVDNSDGCASVTCVDGSSYEGEAVVGADGIWSKLRRKFSDDRPVSSQYVAYRGTIPTKDVRAGNLDDVVLWLGPNLHIVHYPVRNKELYNLVVVFKSFRYQENSDDWGTTEELDERFSGCCDEVKQAVSYVQRHRRWPLYDREPIDNWTDGKVVLLGDSAHPMLQFLAQGACQALEDAASLADHLERSPTDISGAFAEYQRERIPRTSLVQRRARLFGDIMHTDDKVAILLRDTLFLQRNSKDSSVVDWLYGHQQKVKS